jgi:hypothetical protein
MVLAPSTPHRGHLPITRHRADHSAAATDATPVSTGMSTGVENTPVRPPDTGPAERDRGGEDPPEGADTAVRHPVDHRGLSPGCGTSPASGERSRTVHRSFGMLQQPWMSFARLSVTRGVAALAGPTGPVPQRRLGPPARDPSLRRCGDAGFLLGCPLRLPRTARLRAVRGRTRARLPPRGAGRYPSATACTGAWFPLPSSRYSCTDAVRRPDAITCTTPVPRGPPSHEAHLSAQQPPPRAQTRVP